MIFALVKLAKSVLEMYTTLRLTVLPFLIGFFVMLIAGDIL